MASRARARETRHKVLHAVAGRPLLEHVLGLSRQLGSVATVVVVAPDQPAVRLACDKAEVVEQREQLGTGHAVLQARDLLRRRSDRVLVLYGDTPLFRLESAR